MRGKYCNFDQKNKIRVLLVFVGLLKDGGGDDDGDSDNGSSWWLMVVCRGRWSNDKFKIKGGRCT